MDTLVWGGTGQAKVLRPIIEHGGHSLVMMFDRDQEVEPPFDDVPLINDETELNEFFARYAGGDLAFAVAVGGEERGFDRVKIGNVLCGHGFDPLALKHERAWVAPSAQLGKGCQILAMAVVCEQVRLGGFCIVNTNASVDHDCRLGKGVHVMPGATIAGCVEIADYVTIGSNATVLPRVRIGTGAVVGAGAVVTSDVPARAVVVGMPARRVRSIRRREL